MIFIKKGRELLKVNKEEFIVPILESTFSFSPFLQEIKDVEKEHSYKKIFQNFLHFLEKYPEGKLIFSNRLVLRYLWVQTFKCPDELFFSFAKSMEMRYGFSLRKRKNFVSIRTELKSFLKKRYQLPKNFFSRSKNSSFIEEEEI